MKTLTKAAFATLLGTVLALAEPARPPIPEEEMVSRYVTASQTQQDALRGGTVEENIDADVPQLKKHGTLHALKSITKLGKITFRVLGFNGDNTVKTEVIARYMKAEVDAADSGGDLAVTPAHYKFKYKGTEQRNGRAIYILHVNPRQKRVGLFKGELWLDAETCMPVRESGYFVKSPSIFLKKMQFVREYGMQNGVAIPQRLESKADVRFIGPVELNIDYASFSKDDGTDTVAASAADQQ